MNIEQVLVIRRTIMAMEVGESRTVSIPGSTNTEIQVEAARFAKDRKMPCVFTQTPQGLKITRAATVAVVNPDLDGLEVGGSKLFELPPSMHQRIRLAASNKARTSGMRLSCLREGEFIRVTRLPATDAEAAACGPIKAAPRATKYDLERLATEDRITFDVARADHAKIRLAVHRQMVKTNWTIRCRLQDDGTMLVYRTDSAAPQPGAAAADAAE